MMKEVNIYSDKLDTALQQKQNDKYKSVIKSELSNEIWQHRKNELEKLFRVIKTQSDFEKYQKELIKMFDNLYEVITAPGVDDFINWMNDITENINESNSKILRSYLVEHFSDAKFSDAIESINSNKDLIIFDNNKTFIFQKLLQDIRKHLKKDVNDFLIKSSEFENNIDGFLELLEQKFVDLNQIKELRFKNQNELYSEEQINNNVEWYDEIISQILKENQSLKPITNNEENYDLVTKTKKRIDDIKDCIEILSKKGIAKYDDEILKNIFPKFVDVMIKFDGGIKKNLEEFLEKEWIIIESNYFTIKEFFNAKKDVEYNKGWDSYPSKEEIEKLLIEYNVVIKENPLQNYIADKNTSIIKKTLTEKVKAINNFNEDSDNIRKNIIKLFGEIIAEYKDKNLSLLSNLAISNQPIEDIKGLLNGLKNGMSELEKTNDLLSYLSNKFKYDLNSYSELTTLFTKALQESGKSDHLEWLESKLKEPDCGNLTVDDFENQELIKDLLADGLIKINIEKQF